MSTKTPKCSSAFQAYSPGRQHPLRKKRSQRKDNLKNKRRKRKKSLRKKLMKKDLKQKRRKKRQKMMMSLKRCILASQRSIWLNVNAGPNTSQCVLLKRCALQQDSKSPPCEPLCSVLVFPMVSTAHSYLKS